MHGLSAPFVIKFENTNGLKNNEAIRRAELSKFPKISPKLDSYLKTNHRKSMPGPTAEKNIGNNVGPKLNVGKLLEGK